MIIIFNISGALVAVAGILFGTLLMVATGSPVVGVGTLAGIWCWHGRAKTDKATGMKRVAPSVFFIPMFYWGLIASLALIPAAMVDFLRLTGDSVPLVADHRADKFQLDEVGLETNLSDDVELSKLIFQLLDETLPRSSAAVRIKISDSSLLVLVRLANLSDISETDRRSLLGKVRSLVEDRHPELKAYVGIKGRLVYGAIATPGRAPEIGTIVDTDLLYPFYAQSGSGDAENEQSVSVNDAIADGNEPVQSTGNEFDSEILSE